MPRFAAPVFALALLAAGPAIAAGPQRGSPDTAPGLRAAPGTVSHQAIDAYSEHPVAFGHRAVKVEATLSFQSEYIFRGQQLAKHSAQGGLEISSGGFYAGGWAIVPTEDRFNAYQTEIDLYGGYGFDLSRLLYADVGITGYLYNRPQLLFGARDSLEVYGGLSLNLPFKPGLYGFYDLRNNAVTVEGSLENTLPFGHVDLVTGATGGYSDSDGFAYSYVRADAELIYNFNRRASFGLGGHWAVADDPNFLNGLSLTQHNTTWYGLTLKTRN